MGYIVGGAIPPILAGWLITRFVKNWLGLILAVLVVIAWGAVSSLPRLLRMQQGIAAEPPRPPQTSVEAKERIEKLQRAAKDMSPRMQKMVEISTRLVTGLNERVERCQQQVTALLTPEFNDDSKIGAPGVLEQRLEAVFAFWRQAKDTADYRALMLPRMREEFVRAGLSLTDRETMDFLAGVEKTARSYERPQFRFYDAQIGLADAMLWRLGFLRDRRGEWELRGNDITFKVTAAAEEWQRREEAFSIAATHFDQTNEELEAARRGEPLRR